MSHSWCVLTVSYQQLISLHIRAQTEDHIFGLLAIFGVEAGRKEEEPGIASKVSRRSRPLCQDSL